MSYNTSQLFNFIQGSDITGESSYDIWKRLNPEGTEAEFLAFIQSGPQGEKGDPATVYSIVSSDTVIKKCTDDRLLPEVITFNSHYRVGTDPTYHDYAGIFIIEESTDGSVWTTKYTSEIDEVLVEYTLSSSDISLIRCTLYNAEDNTHVLDTLSIPVLVESVEGITAVLSNAAHVVATDANGNIDNYTGCDTSIQVFNGVKDITDQATFEITATEGLIGEWDLATYTYTVTEITTDTAYADITATYKEATVTKRFSVSKAKPGKSAFDLWLEIKGNEGKTYDDFIRETYSQEISDVNGLQEALDSKVSQLEFDELSGNIAYISSDNENVDVDIYTALTTLDIVDNLESSNSKLVLSARQGKVLNEKINTIISGDITTDANTELVDIRIDVDGVTHETAGDAVRSQINKLEDSIQAVDTANKTLETNLNSAVSGLNTKYDELKSNSENSISNIENDFYIPESTDCVLENSYPGLIKVNEIGGKTEQFSTTGAQLVDWNSSILVDTGLTVTSLTDGGIKVTGTPTEEYTKVVYVNSIELEPGKYYISGGSTDVVYAQVITYDAEDNQSAYINQVFEITGSESRIAVMIQASGLLEAIDYTIYPMLHKGETEISWEPYTGAIASPNPSYPQEIKKSVITGVKTHGKNFWNLSDYSGNISGIEIKSSSATQTVTIKGTSTEDFYRAGMGTKVILSPGSYKFFVFGDYSTIYKFLYYDSELKDVPGGVVTFTEAKEVSFGVHIEPNITIDATLTFMCIRQDESEVYEPYKESVVEFSEPVTLYGISDTHDILTTKQIERKYNSITNLTFEMSDNYDVGNSKLAVATIADNIKANDVWSYNLYHSICNKLPAKNVLSVDNDGFYIVGSAIYARIARCSDIDEFNSKMSDAEFIYELAEPVMEELPLVDQNALNSLKAFDGITYVEFISDIQPTLNCEYPTSKENAYILEGLFSGNSNNQSNENIDTSEIEADIAELKNAVNALLNASTYVCNNLK